MLESSELKGMVLTMNQFLPPATTAEAVEFFKKKNLRALSQMPL